MSTEESLYQLVKAAYREMTAAVERQIGMSFARLQLLLLLHREGELSQAELQRRLGVDGAVITRQVKQLEEDGLIRRRPDPRDNRFTLVLLTAAGRDVTANLHQQRPRFEAQFAAGLDPAELAALHSGLARLRENARAAAAVPL